jgi:uncharacterized membrane protein YkoI
MPDQQGDSMYRLAVTASVLLLLGGMAGAGQDRRTSLDEAVSDARERYNGKVLSAETHRHDGRETHNVRVLTGDGRVRRYRVDADAEPPAGRKPHKRR